LLDVLLRERVNIETEPCARDTAGARLCRFDTPFAPRISSSVSLVTWSAPWKSLPSVPARNRVSRHALTPVFPSPILGVRKRSARTELRQRRDLSSRAGLLWQPNGLTGSTRVVPVATTRRANGSTYLPATPVGRDRRRVDSGERADSSEAWIAAASSRDASRG